MPLPEEKPYEETFTPSPTEIYSPNLKKAGSIVAEDMPLPEEKPYEETFTPSPTEITSPYLKIHSTLVAEEGMPLPEEELPFEETFLPSIIDKYLDVLEKNKSQQLNFSRTEIEEFVGQTVFQNSSVKRRDFILQAWQTAEKERRSVEVRLLLFITVCKNGQLRDLNKPIRFNVLFYGPKAKLGARNYKKFQDYARKRCVLNLRESCKSIMSESM